MSTNFTLERAEQFLGMLKSTIEQNCLPIKDIEYYEGKENGGEWTSFPAGSYWGKHDTWYWFKTSFVIPEEYAGKRVCMRLVTGRENAWNSLNPQFLVYVNGKVVQALDTNHHAFTLTMDAVAGEKYEIEFHAYAGREYDNTSFQDLPLQFRLHAYCHESLSEKVYYDIFAAKSAAEIYGVNDYLRIQIESHITKALNLLDCRVLFSEEYFASLKLASEYMDEEFFGKFCGHENVIANCVGHTHIDVAWLWQLEQTRAKAVRSFSTELALMDEYPEHRFGSSQPQLYQFVKEDCPEVYERIKERVKEGRWEVEGAMWVEADCNLISGESMIRQVLHGKRFMKDEFDVESKVLWLPDVFGYSAALPQILKKSGVDTFVTSKIHWNETNHFPYDTFNWKGIDGTEILSQFITASEPDTDLGVGGFFSTYNAQILPITLEKGWEIYQQKDINNEILVSFGYGDGGGGVTREMVEMHKRMEHGIPGSPKTRVTNIGDTISRIRKNIDGKKVPKWFGELYLEFHRGTYTSMAKNKRFNRMSEFLMQQTESVSLLDKILLGGEYDKKELYDGWTTVLLNQFHDIIPGSSITEVYEDSEKQYLKLIEENTTRSMNAIEHLASQTCEKGIFVYNPTGIVRDGIIEVDGQKRYVKDVPAFGWKTISDFQEQENGVICTEKYLENKFYIIELDDTGALTRIYDKENDREVLNGRANVLEGYDDHPRKFDNWELCNYYSEKKWEMNDVSSVRVESDEISASVIISRSFLNSTIEQKVTIYNDIARIDFDFDADWNEHHIFVKTAFPVDILADKATYEIQYGAVERPTHTNTSWDAAKFEVCAHKWADYSEYGYGVALMNDCKYGHDIHDGVMRLSLIKCGTYPNPTADIGHHHARYSIVPHAGRWQEAEIANQAYAFNCPLIAVKAEGKGNLPAAYSFAASTDSGIILTVAKEACDNEDIIIRAYESQGKRTKTDIKFGFEAMSVYEVGMMENDVIEDVAVMKENATINSDVCIENSDVSSACISKISSVFKPYEIKTYRVKR